MGGFSTDFAADFLRLHNHYRAIHGAPPLQIDEQLNEYAQEWANVLANRGALEYRPETEYGENLYASRSIDLPREIKPKDPLECWYREGTYFKYGEEQPKSLKDVRHFTQLIWKETGSMGLGMASDTDGRIYLVCNYNPAGNVDGRFAENVLPPASEEQELLRHEAEGIRTIETQPEAVKSMERLYAVPSEKLRVWLVWLTKIGEMADEWQRWLRAHIDLTVRLGDHLLAVQEAISSSKEVEDEVQEASKDEVRTIEEEAEFEAQEASNEEAGDSAADLAETIDGEATEEGDISVVEEAADASVVQENGDDEDDAENLDDTTTKSKITFSEDVIYYGGSEVELGTAMTWPIGSPWQHLGLEDLDEQEEFEKLSLPRNELEFRELAKKFTQQATVYRSYYKHWRETTDQAIKEIGGRLVLATYKVQGKDETGCPKKPPCPRSKSQRLSRSKAKRSKVDVKPRVESAGRESVESNDEKYYTPPTSFSEEPTDVEETTITEEPTGTEEITVTEEPTDTEVTIDNGVDSSMVDEGKPPDGSGKEPSRAAMQPSKESVKSAEVDDLVRDCARAEEPIPYIFYLKAEPDVEIATEHDDEEVIEADVGRENVIGDYKRLFFNLTDKPCKGGKPWI